MLNLLIMFLNKQEKVFLVNFDLYNVKVNFDFNK